MENNEEEVLVAYTRPQTWRVIKRRMIANQKSNRCDVDYVAFLRVRRKDKFGNSIPSAITHIAKVKEIKIVEIDLTYFKENMPEAIELAEEKEWHKMGPYNKEYHFEWIKKIDKPVVHRHGDRSRGQVLFYTTLEEIKKSKFIGDIKTRHQLNNQ
jgi:hypothetical protein